MINTAEMGSLFKKIRRSKKLSLKDVAGDYLSISFLSKFERGDSEISLSRFLLLLSNLDVSIEEFYGILANENPTDTEKLLERVSKAFYQNNVLALEKYLAEENRRYEQTNNKTYLYNVIMIESFLSSIGDYDIKQEHIDRMTDYLFAIEQWGKRELIILGNSMPSISTETLKILTKDIIYKTTLFGNSESNYRVRIGILINAISEFLKRSEFDITKAHLDMLLALGIPESFLYEKMEYNFLLGTFWLKTGRTDMGKKMIDNCLEVLRHLGADHLLLSKEKSYKELLDSII